MSARKHLLYCLSALLFGLSAIPCAAQSGDSVAVRYKARYAQLYHAYVQQPDHVPTLIALSDFYADSLNPMFNRPMAMDYIYQADLQFVALLQDNKRIREANRIIAEGVSIGAIRQRRHNIAEATFEYLQTQPPLSRAEIDLYTKYFYHEPAILQALNQLKVNAAYRDATDRQSTEAYYAFLDSYAGTAEADSAEAILSRQAIAALQQATTEAEVDAIAKPYGKSAVIQRAAEKRKGRLAYLDAYNRHSIEAYERFLSRYTTADDYANALDMMDTLIAEHFYLMHSAQDYIDFIDTYGDNPLAEQALQQLRQRIVEHHDAGAAELYLSHYPLDADYNRIYQTYYSWHAAEGNRDPIADFAQHHPDYPQMETLRSDRAQGARIDAFDLSRRYNAALQSEYAAFIRMNTGKRIVFVALQRMLQADLDAQRWKAALETLQEAALSFEDVCKKEYQALKKLLESKDDRSATLLEPAVGDRYAASPDGQLYYSLDGQIFRCEAKGSGNGTPITFDGGKGNLELFCLYDNGNRMLLGRDGDIWSAHHDNGVWHLDGALPSPVNSPHIETDAYMLPDGSGMLFASDRPGGCNIQRSGSPYHGDNALATDLYYVAYAGGQWGQPVRLDMPVNSPYCERYPVMSRNGKTLYFVSDGRGGLGYGDIYRANRLDDSWQRWSEPENLGREVNSAHRERALSLNADESRLLFLSDRGKGWERYSVATRHKRNAAQPTTGGKGVWKLDDVAFHSGDDGEYITLSGSLDPLVRHLLAHPQATVDIVSHYEGKDAEESYRMSLKRGEAVRRYLASQGVHRQRIRVSAYGNATESSHITLSARVIEK